MLVPAGHQVVKEASQDDDARGVCDEQKTPPGGAAFERHPFVGGEQL